MALLVCAGTLVLAGCEARILGTSEPGAVGSGPGADVGGLSASNATPTGTTSLTADRASFRRLLRREIVRSAADLLGLTSDEAEGLASELPRDLPRSNGYLAPRPLQLADYQGLRAAIEKLVVQVHWTGVAGDWAVSCAPGHATPTAETPCSRSLAERFARRAFRRPASAAELAELVAAYDELRLAPDDLGYADALYGMLELALLSPQFLYAWEQSPANRETLQGTRAVSDSFQRAARLARMLWGTVPDAALGTLADAGALMKDETLKAEAQRLLADSRSRYAVDAFVPEWLEVAKLDTAIKLPATDGVALTNDLRTAMIAEANAYVGYVMSHDPSVRGLLTSDVVMVNGALGAHYGLAGGQGAEFLALPGGANGRAGLLTLGALLTSHSGNHEASPTRYGKFVRTRLLCDPVLPPPPGVSTQLGTTADSTDLRTRLLQHQTNPSCSGCHRQLDPVGFVTLSFDHLGRFKFLDADTSGTVVELDVGQDATITGAAELARRLADSSKVKACFAEQLLRQVTGGEVAPDSSTLARLRTVAQDAGGDIQKTLLQLATSDWLRFHDPVTE